MKTNQSAGNLPVSICRHFNAALVISVSLFFFLIPGLTVIHDLSDPNIRSAGIPSSAWKFHRALSPNYERWAKERLASKQADNFSIDDISGTEWPLFGSVFYLWATESLQDAWEKDRTVSTVAPNVYAKGAIDAAASLVIDRTKRAG